jgi:hypothetical protein
LKEDFRLFEDLVGAKVVFDLEKNSPYEKVRQSFLQQSMGPAQPKWSFLEA